MRINITLIIICLFMTACGAVPTKEHLPASASNGPQKVLVFMDGTANNEGSYTNVSKLYNLVTLQNKTDIKAAYIAGVGTGYRLLGMPFGTGLANDIKQAYTFLTTHYQSDEDKIYLFGFSRGAYGARALAGMIQVAGIPDFSTLTQKQRERSVTMIFNQYRGKGSIAERRKKIASADIPFYQYRGSPPIEFVGIWDTVEALALPDFAENNLLDNPKYIDQLCNTKRVYHALSLDDDRANIFTPVLINKNATKAQCDKEVIHESNRAVNQVFFSGAHADVGGGYEDTTISGVSLNWMIDKLSGDGILPSGTKVYADPYDLTHDPEADLKLFRFKHRSLTKYAALLDDGFRVHQSAIDRLKHVYQQCFETDWHDSENVLRHCFTKNQSGGFDFKEGRQCLIQVDRSGYDAPAAPTHPPVSVASCETEGAVLPCTKSIDIDPKDKNNITDFVLNPAHRYQFSIETRHWADKNSCSTPEVGRRISRGKGSKLTKLFSYPIKLLAYDVRAGYTELVGQIKSDPQPWKTVRIGRLIRNKELYQPDVAGKLIIRANDPQVIEEFYKNNAGAATLYITRVR